VNRDVLCRKGATCKRLAQQVGIPIYAIVLDGVSGGRFSPPPRADAAPAS